MPADPENQPDTKLDKKVLAERLQELKRKRAWFHHFDLPYGLKTRTDYTEADGRNTRKWDRILPLLESFNVKNKRILDIGCSEGFFSSKLAQMGAQGTGIDVDPVCIEKALFIREALQINQFEFQKLNIYSDEFNSLPSFDLTLCLGFLHRVPDPYTAISKLVACSDAILFEWKTFRHPLVNGPYAYMKPEGEDKNNPYSTRYWSLSYESLELILRRLGYKHFRRIQDEYSSRAILIAGRADSIAFNAEKTDIRRKNRFLKILDQTHRYLKTMLNTLING